MADDKDQKMWEDLFGADEGEEGDAGAAPVAGGSPEAKGKKEKKDKKDKKEKRGKKDKGGEDENTSGNNAAAKPPASPRKSRLKKPAPATLEEPNSQPAALLPLTDSQPDTQLAAIEDTTGKREKKDKKEKKEDGKKGKKDKKEKKEKKRKGAPEEATLDAPVTAGDAAVQSSANLFDEFNADVEDPFGVGTDLWEQMDMADGTRSVRSNRSHEAGSAAPMSNQGIPGGGSEVGSEGVLALPEQMPLAKRPKKGIEEPDTIVGKFGKVLDTIKPRRGLTIAEKDAIPYIQDFIQQMVEVAELDEEEWRNGRPMIHKITMLPKAVGVMEKYAFADYFVAYGGVRALALWLQPLPNGENPNVHIRTTLLSCMMRLPITKESLRECKNPSLGMIIKNLKESKEETVANKKEASLLVHKWVGQVLTKKPDLGIDQNEDDEDQRPRGTLQPKPKETYESFLELEAESFTRMHPTLPMPEGKELVIQPMAVHMPVKRDKIGSETNRGKITQVMNVLVKPNKRAWKPYAVAIAGNRVGLNITN